jgi:23S rRNA (adenine2503-C2)-methyltransferase
MAPKLQDIRAINENKLAELFKELDQPAYRAKQIEEWIWQKGVLSFDEMSNLSKELRQILNENFAFYPPSIDLIQQSQDGTAKMRLALHDGLSIESVLIPVKHDDRYTVCVSSQAGCSLNCSFCATGKMGLLRQLTAAEIVDQVRFVQEYCQRTFYHPITNIVYMGMGEPLLNYRQVAESVHRLTSPKGMGLSARRITISTAGIAKMIRKLADDELKVNLALSLHAASDVKRNQIMPINETNDLKTLMEAIQYFYEKTKNRISYEYIALRDFNDHIVDADELIQLCKHFPVRVNIIEYNPIGDGLFSASEENKLDRFMQRLRAGGVMATLRRSRGKDIDAACGQLANK